MQNSPVRALLALLTLAFIGLLAFKVLNRSEPADAPAPSSTPSTPSKGPGPAGPQSKIESPKSKIEPPPVQESHLADELNSPAGTIQADLRIVSEVIDAFRTNFPRDGNPVGDNAEITAALTGKNKLGLALIPPKHPAIKNGALCDRWGTPFFFHAESASKMEIRSAGPDRKMWSADDVVFTP
jgi:hypothetical protein